MEKNAAIDRDKTRRQIVANFINVMISDISTPDFTTHFETPDSKSAFVDLIYRIKSAVDCFEAELECPVESISTDIKNA